MQTLREKTYSLLRWGERFTKTDMIYLAKGGSLLGIGQVVSSFVAFLLSVAFANLFPPEAYGVYKYILSVIAITGAFALTGMDTAVAQAVARGLDGTLRTGFRAMFRWTLITSGITTCVALYYFLNGNSALAWSLIIAALAMPILKSAVLYNGFLIGKKNFGRKVRFGMVYDSIPAMCIAASLFFTQSPLIVVLVYFISYTVTALVLYHMAQKTILPDAPSDPDTQSYSLHLSAMNILGSVSFQIDKVLTFHYLGATQLALYAFALAVPGQIRQIQKHLATLMLPKFSEQSFSAIQKSVGRKMFLFFIAMASITLLYILAAPFIFKFFFPQYIGAIFYSQLFSLVLLTSPSIFFKQALTAHRKTDRLYIINVGIPLIKIVALFIFVPLFGITGAIISLLTTELIGLLISGILFYRIKATYEIETIGA